MKFSVKLIEEKFRFRDYDTSAADEIVRTVMR